MVGAELGRRPGVTIVGGLSPGEMKVNAGLSEINDCLERIQFIIMSSASTIISKINLFNTPFCYINILYNLTGTHWGPV